MKKFVILISINLLCVLSSKAQTSFKDFVQNNKNSLNSQPDLCEQFFGNQPLNDATKNSGYQILLTSDNYVAILYVTDIIAGNKKISDLTTYDWQGNYIDNIEYEYQMSDETSIKSRVCKLDDTKITCTVINKDNSTSTDETFTEAHQIKDDGTFQPID